MASIQLSAGDISVTVTGDADDDLQDVAQAAHTECEWIIERWARAELENVEIRKGRRIEGD